MDFEYNIFCPKYVNFVYDWLVMFKCSAVQVKEFQLLHFFIGLYLMDCPPVFLIVKLNG